MKKYALGLILIGAIVLTSCHPTEVVVKERPVAPVYTRPHSPGPSYIWIEGGWVRSRGAYVYRQGYWAKPRYHNRQYRPGYWRQTRGGWVWIEGGY